MTAAAVAIVLLILVSEGICEIQLKGFEGGGLLIKFKYDNIYKHKTKTFCKREDRKCLFERQQFVGRIKEFNVVDEGYYVVFITQLALTDAGDYRFSVENEDEDIDVTLNIKRGDCCKGPLTVMSRQGETVAISCKYPKESKGNRQVFCKQGHVFTCSNLIEASSGRFTVIDDDSLNVFTVSIRNVSRTDPGIYWCGVRTGANTGSVALITEVHLKEAPSLPPSSSVDMPLIIGVCLTVAVLILVIAVFIFLKYRHQRTSKAKSSPAPATLPGDPDSRTPRDKKRVGDKSTAHADCEYAEIKGAVRPPHQQRADSAATSDAHPAHTSEGPSYATVHFRKHPEQQTDAKATAESLQEDNAGCEYAAIKHRC
ncbi:polymeric immunoglobulin receptor-like isoform X1 [Clupea harengus]|uniref:polymeric immunoglobulin receptor-like isoform X1 n=1 Tax=Clupea harengus TaxID=7950 RepID=UPI0012ABE819|nr:polymeric immunoglobulin receptor-like isoform X1 [Clupea harengus]